MDMLKNERFDALCNELSYLTGNRKQDIINMISNIDKYNEFINLVADMRNIQHKREHEADIAMMNGMSRCDLGLLNRRVEDIETQVDVKLIELKTN